MSTDGAYSDSYASNAFSMFDGANNNTHLTYDLVQVRFCTHFHRRLQNNCCR